MTDTIVLPDPTTNGAASGVTARVVMVSPELAAAWLEHNPRNRRVSDKHAAMIAGAITRDEWRMNGAPIVRGADGDLLDGQHRLTAVVLSGRSVPMLVVDGVEPEAQITIDAGRKRSFADQLKLLGETEYTSVAALVMKIYRWETSQIRSLNRPPTYDQLLKIYQREQDTLDLSIRESKKVRRALPVSTSIMALCHWVFAKLDGEDAEFFFARLRDGQGLVEGDAILTLRKFILNAAVGPRGRGRLDDPMLLAVTIKAWNAFRAGTQIKQLWWRSGGARPEQFPEPA